MIRLFFCVYEYNLSCQKVFACLPSHKCELKCYSTFNPNRSIWSLITLCSYHSFYSSGKVFSKVWECLWEFLTFLPVAHWWCLILRLDRKAWLSASPLIYPTLGLHNIRKICVNIGECYNLWRINKFIIE